jgi:hypothetical protein
LFSPSLIRSLASFLPPSSLFFFFWPRSAVQLCHRLCALSSSVIVYFIDFFVSLALGPLDPHASWLLFFLEIFISSSLDFAWSCCALNPRAAARSVFLLAFSHWPIVSCAVLGFQWSVIFSRVRVGSPTAGFDFTHSVLFPTPRRVLVNPGCPSPPGTFPASRVPLCLDVSSCAAGSPDFQFPAAFSARSHQGHTFASADR